MKGNRNTELPSHVVFVDTETQYTVRADGTQVHSLNFGWALYHRVSSGGPIKLTSEARLRFTETENFWEWLVGHCPSKTRLYVYCHNWNFDGAILRLNTHLQAEGWAIKRYINDKPPFILSIRKGTNTICFVDTLNYFQSSLSNLGDNLGIAKLPMPERDASSEEWDIYCLRDVAVMVEAMRQYWTFIESYDLGNYQLTLASQAFTAYRHRFMGHEIYIHDREWVSEYEREAYKGGRVECLKIGPFSGQHILLDINSMYPYVMREYEYPTRLVEILKAPSFSQLAATAGEACLLAHVILKMEENPFGIRRNGKLIFPTGRFSTWLTTREISYALSHDLIESCTRAFVYDKAPIFVNWVDHMYAKRLEFAASDNPSFAYLAKILLNSLYGKFGQNGRRWEIVGPIEKGMLQEWWDWDEEQKRLRQYRLRLGVVQELIKEGESYNSFPIIAAHVTADARMYLWRLMQMAGMENVLYVDTDSILCNYAGYTNLSGLLDQTALGMLKLEGEYTEGIIYGAKDYRFGNKERHKGIRATARRLSPNSWAQEQFRSWDWHLSQGTDGVIYIQPIVKHLKRIYDKGTVTSQGVVTPLIMRS